MAAHSKRERLMYMLKALGRSQTDDRSREFRRPQSWLVAFVVLLAAAIPFSAPPTTTPQITEFMALNTETLIDDDDDHSDWLEIHNPTKTIIALGGWHLTNTLDDLELWTFPPVTLYPNSYMIVFASEKDRRALGAPLHTNFRLPAEGVYLALLDPDFNIVSEFFPTYPKQKADFSYGMGVETITQFKLVSVGNPAFAFVPKDDTLALDWTKETFDHQSWLTGTTGIGYDYPGLIGLDVTEMKDVNESVYIRIPFWIDELPEFDYLTLRIQYDDGFIAYLNGDKLTDENDPEEPTWNSGAPLNRFDAEAVVFAEIDVSSATDLLHAGLNVLAIHGLNNGIGSTDLLIRPELIAVSHPTGPELCGYFESPTPGAPNGQAFPGIAGKVHFSAASRTFTTPISVELLPPDDASDEAEIRHTLDGSVPNESSRLYTGPLTIRTTTQVRAKLFEPGLGVGPTVSETYIALASDVVSFTSDLPLVILESFGAGGIPQNSYQPVFMAVFEQVNGRTSLTSLPTLSSRAGIKVRGSSTAGWPKPSLTLETWDEVNDDKNVAPLGMLPESDWVLWGPYGFDLALIRNPFIYELSNQVGRYAVRTRFVEIFLNSGGGALTKADYFGIYAFMEKISRDEDRVNVQKLFPEHDREPGVTGGYMLKIDRQDPGDSGFFAAGQSLCYVYPKEVDIEKPERDPQEKYINSFFNQFGTALNGVNYTDPAVGYARYIDVDSWIDHHLLNVLAVNVDAFRLSTYMFKTRGGKLEMGPIWDFDRSMGSTDGRDANPKVWRGGGDGTDFFNYPWWWRLFTDIDFFQRYIDRWQELKKAPFSLGNINSIIDSMADELRESQVRNLEKWGQTPRYGGYQGEIDHLKQWLADRVDFIDSQFVSPPVFDKEGGLITPGFTLGMTAPKGVIYYTLDGSDPRLSGAKVSPTARLYQEPVALTDTAEVRARVLDLNHVSLTGGGNPPLSSKWSGVTKARFSIYPAAKAGNLVITEINYHPLDPTPAELAVNSSFTSDDFEFIELKNIGTSTLDLTDVEFTGGITFSFTASGITTLAPGEEVVVVKNLAAFIARYGALPNAAGQCTGNLDNAGENLRLDDAAGEVILSFTYRDTWCPLTDGFGFSLVILNEYAPLDTWGIQAAWRSSTAVNGSPGEDDPGPSDIPAIVINEALTNSDPPQVDAIELYNPTAKGTPYGHGVPFDIGGWFLTDDPGTLGKFRIPDGTMIHSGGYLVLTEHDFNADPTGANGFALSSLGEQVYLFSADSSGTFTGYFHGFSFGAAESGVTFGRHVTSTGKECFVAQVSPSLEKANRGPKVGPIVINEIMYNPPLVAGLNNNRDEYIELRNLSSEDVPLFDPNVPSNTWRIQGGVSYNFPPDVKLPAGGYVLLVSFNPITDSKSLRGFQYAYGLDATVKFLGPYTGKLDNSSGRIELLKPDAPLFPPDPDAGFVPYILVDEVGYSDSSPWPPEADCTGNSLQRLVSGAYADDPLNWQAAKATPGRANAEGGVLDADGDGLPNDWESANGLDPKTVEGDHGASGDPDADRLTNLDEYLSGTHPRDPDSFLKVDSITADTSSVVVRFTAVAGKSYTILYNDRIEDGAWLKLGDIPAQTATGIVEVPDPGAGNTSMRFYRLVTPQLP